MYKWSSPAQALFQKSKLSGAALEFYVKSTACKNSTSVSQLFKILKKHLKHPSSANITLQYNAIKFSGNELISSFATLLDDLKCRWFPDLSNDSIEKILTAKFYNLLPQHYKF